jgi:hypothetical protein
MYCWSCGTARNDDERCQSCGAGPTPPPREVQGTHGVRVCMGCGYRGEGIGYFRRAGHVALLVGAALLTYGLGGLVYWLVKRDDRVCPRCGLSWARSRPIGATLPPGPEGEEQADAVTGPPQQRRSASARRRPSGRLPSGGTTRRVAGVLMALGSVFFLGLGITEADAVLGVMSLVLGLAGASSFAWGWKARQRRREAILREMQGQVLSLARARGGTLTVTDVASELDLSLEGAERVLLSLDDGFRIRSDVTEEGLLVFDFPEIRWGTRGPARTGSDRLLESDALNERALSSEGGVPRPVNPGDPG